MRSIKHILKKASEIDIRPLDQRTSKKDLRKGIPKQKRILIVGQGVDGNQLQLWKQAEEIRQSFSLEDDSLTPEYIKHLRNIAIK